MTTGRGASQRDRGIDGDRAVRRRKAVGGRIGDVHGAQQPGPETRRSAANGGRSRRTGSVTQAIAESETRSRLPRKYLRKTRVSGSTQEGTTLKTCTPRYTGVNAGTSGRRARIASVEDPRARRIGDVRSAEVKGAPEEPRGEAGDPPSARAPQARTGGRASSPSPQRSPRPRSPARASAARAARRPARARTRAVHMRPAR